MKYSDYIVPTDSIQYYSYYIKLKDNRLRNTAGKECDANLILGYNGKLFKNCLSFSNVYSKSGFFANAHGIEIRLSEIDFDKSFRDIDYPYSFANHLKIQNNSVLKIKRSSLCLDLAFQINSRKEYSEPVSHGYMPKPDGFLERMFDKKTYSANLNYKTILDCLLLYDKDNLAVKLENISLNHLAQNNSEEITFCPTPGCSYICFFDKNGYHLNCPLCKKDYCLRCKTDWHFNSTCEEYQKSKKEDENDAKFEEYVKGSKFKQCPKCKRWVEKISGCDHIDCPCGTPFCYRCGKIKDLNIGHGCRNCNNYGLFGFPQNRNNNLFGNIFLNNQNNQGGGLFGNNNQGGHLIRNNNQGRSLFGNNNQGSSLFGNNNQEGNLIRNNNQGSSLFRNNNQG